ncbi:MAG: DUF1476 domain-containing protein [Rhodospirillales bacterium]|nr:DUF1476 domain-containing protein [Rhodospirillales bacterium]MCW8861693.1 DUF1476 domain-containing protein [Rhodospirillales bacterium]MCW8951406.1 DUF1476 domain-containing protein [Rhodospirillales bacterium]MCW9001645.1 DUF1476 domain-containing protein [Rhodospirillales bacterium]
MSKAETIRSREKGFEAKYKHDEEVIFKAHARRDKLFGLWAAGLMGLSGDEAEAYALDLVVRDLEKKGEANIVVKVLDDFAARGIELSDDVAFKELDRLYVIALEQVCREFPTPLDADYQRIGG